MSFKDNVITGLGVTIILAIITYFGTSMVILAGEIGGYWQISEQRFEAFETGMVIEVILVLVIIVMAVLWTIGQLTNKYILKL